MSITLREPHGADYASVVTDTGFPYEVKDGLVTVHESHAASIRTLGFVDVPMIEIQLKHVAAAIETPKPKTLPKHLA